VDHGLDVAGLALDGRGELVEGFAVLGDDAAVLAADALGREDDRRQRVLDLVRNAPRDVGPGGRALRGDELGDVVERHDRADFAGTRLFAGDADGEDALLLADGDRDLVRAA